MYRRFNFFVATIAWLTLNSVNGQTLESRSAAELKLALKKLANTASVLYLAAHPDDENTGLIAYIDNELLARTAYLSLTRGDGGQNLIGPEQGELLGLIRTQELLEARKIDKGEQFFTRAYDFGFSKSAEESFNIWGKDSVLHDVVWVIRKFQPDIIITRFPDYESYGHGHHTASAILAKEAFSAAADSTKFPEQLKYVSTWQPKRLLYNSSRWWKPNLEEYYAETGKKYITVDISKYNPLTGASYTEIAAASRSMHKSQGFGTAPKLGEQIEFLEHRAGSVPQSGILDGIETSWNKIPGGAKVQKILNKAIQTFDPEDPSQSIPQLLAALNELNKLPHSAVVDHKKDELKHLITEFAGIWSHAYAKKYYVSPGDSLTIDLAFINRSDYPVQLESIVISPSGRELTIKMDQKKNKLYSSAVQIQIPDTTKFSQPYWLNEKRKGGLFPVHGYESLGKPEESAAVKAKFNIKIGDQTLSLIVPVKYQWTDPVHGELFRPVEITPPVTVNFSEPSYLFTSDKGKLIKLVVKSLSPDQKGSVLLQVPEGWSYQPDRIEVNLNETGEEKIIEFTVSAPTKSSSGEIHAFFRDQDIASRKAVNIINYPHINVQTVFPEAAANLVKIDIQTGDEKIAYIPGAGDLIPDALTNLGYIVKILNPENVASENLSNYDVIITGIRAYNTIEEMSFLNNKLLEFVKEGGRLIVQYNVNRGLSTEQIGPYPFKLSRDRVTVEDSPVKMLADNHPVLNNPNRITENDFQGWIQERGLYFANEWSDEYTAVLGFQDPGEDYLNGSLLVAEYGKGTFIYTGISFFRQLPAGVAGAYKLFANLVSYESK